MLKNIGNINIPLKIFENILLSVLLFIVFLIIRKFFYKGIESFGKSQFLSPKRTKRTKRIMIFFIGITVLLILLLVWGIKIEKFFLIVVTTFTIVGTACFASWSNLSNISSGVILFFYYNVKLGDKVRLGSGDNQIEGVIHNMKLFYVEIITLEDEIVLYPNNTILHQPMTILKK